MDEARARLAALAQGGTAGLKEFEAAQAQQASMRQQALAQMVAGQQQRGAPAALQAETAGQVGGAYDRHTAAIGELGTAHGRLLSGMAGAHSNYMREVAAAEPLVRKLAEQRAAAKAQEEATPGAVIGRLGGVGVAERLIERGVPGEQAKDPGRAYGVRKAPISRDQAADRVATQLGLPDGYGRALLPETAADKPEKRTQGQHRSNVTARVQEHASPYTALAFNEMVAGASSLPEALATLDGADHEQLRKDGVSSDVLKRWIIDYFANG